jgi:hypothetical protein
MKKLTVLLLLVLPFIEAFRCNRDLYDPHNPSIPIVMLQLSVNSASETMKLGDTLKLRLIVPDTLDLISKITGSTSRVAVSSLEMCSWIYYYYSVDTVSKRVSRIIDNSAYASEGNISTFALYINKFIKPFASELTIVPRMKGLYYIEFGTQETRFKFNNSIEAGLRINVNVADQHWYLIDPHLPGLIPEAQQRNAQGWGWYCFRVK